MLSDNVCWRKGFNLGVGNIKSVTFTTVQACKEECAKTEGCVAFTTVAGTYNKCYLKKKTHAAETANVLTISSFMSCEGKDK